MRKPFKRWLAQVGYERVKEIENPDLASVRTRELYEAKGYPQVWIEKRLRATFGVPPGEHSQLKGLDAIKTGNNLRDHGIKLKKLDWWSY
jgi:hypothetical protein